MPHRAAQARVYDSDMPVRLTAFMPERPAATRWLEEPGPLGIGRSAAADICLDHPSVSREHAELRLVEDAWRLADRGSKNGSFIDGARIEEAPLPARAWLRFGDQYRQFNVNAVAGPTYNSLGLESGRNIMRGCPDKRIDLSVSRDIRMGASRTLEFRVNMFNAFNAVVINNRQAQIQFNNPIDQTILNSQTNPDGSLVQTRLTPRTAGFGAATNAENLRQMEVQVRFSF